MAIILVLLAIVWLAVLAPIALRKLSEHQLLASVSLFRHRLSRLQRTQPQFTPAPTGRQDQPRSSHETRQATRYKIERRRRTVLCFGAVILVTFVFGAIPALRPLWYLSLVATICGACYLALLAYVVRTEMLAAQQRDKVVLLAPRPLSLGSSRMAAMGGGAPSDTAQSVSLPPLQPAFRLVERPAQRAN